MIGFGFMDNLVMIQAGEMIDANLGAVLAISTMTAAGFGQCFSDVAGITCGGVVDSAVAKLNLPRHMLSPDQLDLRSSRICTTLGGCIGVVTGCLLGMSCLLFMDTDRAERAKRAKELQSIFESVINGGNELVDADRVTLFMLDKEKEELWSRVATGGTEGIIKVPSASGIVGAALHSKALINVPDAYLDSRFNSAVDQGTGYRTHSMLVTPFFDENGEVLGAIQMINKKKSDGTTIPFDTNDEKLLKMLASHVTAFIRIVNGGD
jgi:Transmembrane protein 65/GAF domain